MVTTGERSNMKQNLNEYVNSFSSQTKVSVESVLSSVSSEKSEIGRLVNRFSSYTSPADYAPRIIRQLEPVQREFIIDMFRDIDLRVKTQFDVSNSLSILSAAMTNVFGGEIEKIEKDLQYLDAYIGSYSFISGEDDLYNASFVENFDNESNSYLTENITFNIPDRDGIPFNSSMSAKVDPSTGKLKYSSSYEASLIPFNPSTIKSVSYETNFPKEYISSDTGMDKVLNNVNSKPWNVTVKSPFIIRESLLDSQKYADFKNGVNLPTSAQIAITFEFNVPVVMSRLRVNPNGLSSLGVAQIIIETQNNSIGNNSTSNYIKSPVLSSPVYIEKNYDIDFDKTYSVSSLTIIFFQKEYNRTKNNALQSEVNSKMISSIYSEIKKSRSEGHDTLQDYVIRFFLRETEKSYILKNNKIYNYNYTAYYPKPLSKTNFGAIEKLARNNYFSDIDAFNKFKNTSLLSNIIFSIISYSLGSRLRNKVVSTYVESNIRDTQKPVSSFYSSGMIPVGDSNIVDKNIHFFNQTLNSVSKEDATELLNNVEDTNMYEYSFSVSSLLMFIKNEISISSQKKSFFVSKKIPTKGRPIRAKMLAKYFDELNYSNEDPSTDKTSVEFSITTKESPSAESDWLPILPYTESFVRSELLIPNSSGECTLRFEPLPESVVMYEKQKERSRDSYVVNMRNIQIKSYLPSETYFVSYKAKYPQALQEISLNPSSLSTPLLVTPSTSGSNGEYFESANQSNRVRLSYTPHVDQVRFANASYSSYVGTIASTRSSYRNVDNSAYSPVKIIFDDGTSAINITNYIIDNNQIESFYETTNVLFIHYGDSILFNQPIKKPFRVLYQYIPDSFRYRVVMRSLTNDEQNYTVDRLIFKFSTEKRDNMLINLVKYDNLFKNKVN